MKLFYFSTLFTKRAKPGILLFAYMSLVIILIPNGAGMSAHADLFGISLDNVCKTFHKNNLSSNCPTPEQINLFFPGSPCDYRGSLCLEQYRFSNKNHYIIDPPVEIRAHIKMVEVRHNFDEFHFQDFKGFNVTTRNLVYGVDRFVDSCRWTYINADSWLSLIGDSIWYMDNGCNSNYTMHTPERYEQLNTTTHNIAESYKWQLDQWIKESLIKCKGVCKEY